MPSMCNQRNKIVYSLPSSQQSSGFYDYLQYHTRVQNLATLTLFKLVRYT